MARILVVDDDHELLNNVSEIFSEEGFEVLSATSGGDAVALAKGRGPDLVVCDIAMPGLDGYAVLRELREHPTTTNLPFIFLSASAERHDVRVGMNLGADDYVTKPFELTELIDAVRARLRRQQERAARADAAVESQRWASAPARSSPAEPARPGLVLVDNAMRQIYAELEQVACSQLNVLILGETGVGKEVLARSLHDLSPRHAAPFLPLNCAALNEQLLESELFGHERGAFTGAHRAQPGLLEAADGGTVFLDEVGDLPLSMQTKLLRVLEDRHILRVGGRSHKIVDVRFVAATNRDLRQEIGRRTFREDLYYRLNGTSFTLPPLRERRAEILPLCQVFVARACAEHGRPDGISCSERTRELLEGHAWPGNVRELKNTIERAVVLCKGARLEPEHLPLELRVRSSSGARLSPPDAESRATLDRDPTAQLRREIAELERERILDALDKSGGNQGIAAERLGISRRTLVYRLSTYGLTRPRRRD